MKSRFVVLCALVAFAIAPAVLQAGTEAEEAVAGACLLVLGRAPTPQELSQAAGSGASIKDQITALKQRLKSDAALQRETVIRSWKDAVGRMPSATDASDKAGSYAELMQRHIAWLRAHGDAYDQVIRRVYPLVIHRDVYPEEIAYWKKYPPIPFALLVGCVENWARRNQPGLMVTAGTPTMSMHSEYLVTARLSPTMARQAAGEFGIDLDSMPPTAASQPHHLVAVGGASIATDGGIYFVAAGRPDLVP